MSEGRDKIGVIGASGYTGADLVRLAARHPAMEIAVLTANTQAGKTMAEVFPHLAALPLPRLVKNEDGRLGRGRGGVLRPAACDQPGGDRDAAATISRSSTCRPISACATRRPMSNGMAGRTRRWSCRASAVYGLTEHYREDIRRARLVACPGCYPTAVLTWCCRWSRQG